MQEASLAWVEESSLQEKNMSGFSATPVAVVGGGEVKEKAVSGLMGHTVLSVPASNMPWGTLKIYHTVTLTTLKHRPHSYTDIAGPKGQLVMELR